MTPFTTLTAVAAPLPRENVDTDQIFPSRYAKTIRRSGLGHTLFGHWRYREDGSENPDFVLNRPAYRDAGILVAGQNFGCGSSREHAPWALLGFGIRAVIAPSFADIFRENCFKNGILPVVLPPDAVADIIDRLTERPGATMTIDLAAQTLSWPGNVRSFPVEPHGREALLAGRDEIDDTLQRRFLIDRFEALQRARRPWTAEASTP